MVQGRLHFPVSDEANELLTSDPFALLIGMVLDQQIPLEKAFSSPLELQKRLDTKLDPVLIADMDPEVLTEIFVRPPALHRFPAANAKRVQQLAQILVDQYNADAASVWNNAHTGTELLSAVRKLPGFGEQKAKIFVALLGKQLAVRPEGWQAASTPFGDKGVTMSVADIVDEPSLLKVREWKAARKAAAKAAVTE